MGDGARKDFQIVKEYASGAQRYARPIVKPVPGSLLVRSGGTVMAEGVDFAVDATRGIILMTSAPKQGAPVTAGFEFDVPVRFDTDRIVASLAGFSAGEIPSVPVVEVRV